MANPLRITPSGRNLLVHMSDRTVLTAYPTGSTTFQISKAGYEDPTPNPDPDPGTDPPEPGDGTWQWPFQYSKWVILTGYYAPLAQFSTARKNPVTGIVRPHLGLDFGAGGIAGQAIPCASDGTVAEAGFNGAMGNHVIVNHAGGFVTKYFHMVATPAVSTGQKVAKGQKLGNVGSTGLSTGAHLHWETHSGGVAQNPRDFMKARGVPES